MKKLAFVFSGQGSQKVGMGKKFCEQFTVANRTFEEASDVIGIDLKKICFEGSTNELTKTENAQPAILTTSVAMFRVFMQELGIEPYYIAGHSLGEFSALTAAESIEFSDAVQIVRQRGKFMQESVELGEGKMVAIGGISQKQIMATCIEFNSNNDQVVISNFNSPNQIVISGHQTAVDKVSQHLLNIGARVTPLKVSAAFHSPLMEHAALKLEDELKKYKFQDPKWPIISNVDAEPYNQAIDVIPNLVTQMTAPVQWRKTMEFFSRIGITDCVELGPQAVLRNLVQKNSSDMRAFSYDYEDDRQALHKCFSNQQPIGSIITRALAIAVSTKNYNYNHEEYQIGVIEPYRQIQKIQENIENGGVEPTVEQMQEAINMLCSVFHTKQTPIKVQQERFRQLFYETGTYGLFPSLPVEMEVGER